MTEAEIASVGENAVEGGRTGVQAGAAAAAARPAEAAIVMGRGWVEGYAGVKVAPAAAEVAVRYRLKPKEHYPEKTLKLTFRH